MHSSGLHNVSPPGRDVDKLGSWTDTSYIAGYVADLEPAQVRGLVSGIGCTKEPIPTACNPVPRLESTIVSWVELAYLAMSHIAKQEVQEMILFSGLIPRMISMPR